MSSVRSDTLLILDFGVIRKIVGVKENLGPKKMCVQKTLEYKKLHQHKIKKNVDPKNIGQILFWSTKTDNPKKGVKN